MPDTVAKKFSELKVGDSAQFDIVIDEALIEAFAHVSGDFNPLHTDKEYVQTTQFGTTIPHGMLASAFFSRLVGMHLPGKYSLYLSQTLNFRAPLSKDTPLQVRGTIVQLSDATRIAVLKTEIISNGAILVDGEARVKLVQ